MFANLYRDPDVTRHKPLLTVPFETKLEVAGEVTGTRSGGSRSGCRMDGRRGCNEGT
jgi:hypothetical protein